MLMNSWTKNNLKMFNKVILGLPVPHAPVAVSWQLCADLRKLGVVTDETNRFDALQVELVRNEPPYFCAIHSGLLVSEGNNHSKIAFVINLAKLLNTCQFRILNFNQDFTSADGFPENLQIWEFTTSEDIKDLIIFQMEVWH